MSATPNLSSNKTLDPIQDPVSPYYLHPSDSQLLLVPIPFNGTGFNDWKRSVTITLSSKNKLAFVNGQIPQPNSTDPNFKSWERINSTIISWFMKVLDPQIARSVLYFPTAQAIWQNLEERFAITSGTQIYSLTQQLFAIDQGSDCLSTYFTKIKMLWDEFDASHPLPTCSCTNCTCGINSKLIQMREEQRLILFLMKLNPTYKTIRGNILMQQPLPSISYAYRLIMQEEKHSDLAAHTNPTT